MANGDKPKKANKPLKPNEIAFIKAYTNIGSPTIGNGTQSALATQPRIGTYDSASQKARVLLRKDGVQENIQEILVNAGLEERVLASQLGQIVQGKHRRESKTVYRGPDGVVHYELVSSSAPKASEITKAIDLANKMSGRYESNRAKADVYTASMKSLIKKYAPK